MVNSLSLSLLFSPLCLKLPLLLSPNLEKRWLWYCYLWLLLRLSVVVALVSFALMSSNNLMVMQMKYLMKDQRKVGRTQREPLTTRWEMNFESMVVKNKKLK